VTLALYGVSTAWAMFAALVVLNLGLALLWAPALIKVRQLSRSRYLKERWGTEAFCH
jgi:hypothetical protein